jgi:hypothetical protein
MKLKARINQKIKQVKGNVNKAFDKTKNVLIRYNPSRVTQRNATLAAIRLNVAGLAMKLYRAGKTRSSKTWQETEKKWEQLGGKKDNLYSALQQGVRVEYKNHPNRHAEKEPVFNFLGEDVSIYADMADQFIDLGYDTGEPVSAGAIALAALPVIAALLDVLKKNGIDTSEDDKTLQAMADKAAEDLAQAEANKLAAEGKEAPDEIDITGKKPEIGEEEETNVLPNFTKTAKKKEADKNLLLYGAGAVLIIVVIYLATKKSK